MQKFDHTVAIKICGITNVADALDCAAAGADMIGLNFSALSLRCITPATAAQIIAAVRPQFSQVKFVGVFVDQELALLREIATDLFLDAVQLHGAETPEYARQLNLPFVIKGLRVGPDFSAAAATNFPSDAILLDTYNVLLPGGTGETFPWSVATDLRVERLILAGGLTSENVAGAIRQVKPFAVDVCSGVEATPRRKDRAKVQEFVESVRAVERASFIP